MGNPFTRLLRRLSVGRKLLLIYLLDLSAVIYVSGILINEKYIAIDFADKEIAGNSYIGVVRDVLTEVAALGVHGPGGGASRPAGLAPALREAESRWGAGMGSTDVSEPLAAALAGLTAETARSDPATVTGALAQGRELITRLGNQSNLILDPDLDSYYTMSLLVLRYPELLEVMDGIGVRLHAGTRGDLRTQYLILEGRLDATAKGIESDFAEAVAATPAVGAALGEGQQRLAAALNAFRGAARQAVDGGLQAADLEEFSLAHGALIGDLRIAWQAANAEMDHLLRERVHGLYGRMGLHLGTALFLLLVILTIVYQVAKHIAVPLRQLSAVTDTVRRTGDHNLRAHWDSSDEIGRLVLGFNDMLAQLDREREVQKELAATARAAAAEQALMEAAPIPMMVTAIPGHDVLHANQPAQHWLAGRRTDPFAVGMNSSVRGRFFQQLSDRGKVDEFEVRWTAGEEPAWAVLSARRLQFQGHDAVLTAFTPINHLKLMEQRLELWAKVFEASTEGILIVGADRRILTVNRALHRSTGHNLADVIGERPEVVLQVPASVGAVEALWERVERRGNWQGEVRVVRRSGESYPAWLIVSAVRESGGGISYYICTSIDISDRKKSEERIRFLAEHDVLTELPNRSLCVERLRLALQLAARSGQQVAVLFIDLDRFKNINDSLGHHVGDGLLRSVARRLQEAVRDGDTVSRQGGDEFVVVLNGVAGCDEVAEIVEQRLIPLIRQPHQIDGAEIHVSCSVGIAVYPDDGKDLDDLMRHADAAMYDAKASGRNAARFFSDDMTRRAQARLRLEECLRHALANGEFQLAYQPRVDARSGALLGAEGLLRWHNPTLGNVSPAHFIPIAEETGLIVPIGEWVIEEACRQMAEWRGQGLRLLPLSINLSVVQLRDLGLVEALRASLARHQVPAGVLEMEITESTLMANVEACLDRLNALRELGVLLSIDDFGTGYSSLNYLNRFPLDKLKIDRSFVHDMLDDPSDLAITKAIIGLGHTLGLKVVAEGVETEQEVITLRRAGCDELQGYYFARPLPAEELVSWQQARGALEEGEPLTA